MSAARNDRGGATLASAVVVLLAGSLLAAAVAEIARTELVVARSRRVLADGLAAADGCLARVVSDLPAGWDHTALLAGADGIAGTADDGLLVAPTGCTAMLLPGPLGAMRPFLDVAASVSGGGRRLRAVVGSTTAPSPALLWFAGTALGWVTGRVQLDGVDPARPDLHPLPAIASPNDPAVVDAWVTTTPGVTLLGATGTPEFAPPPPLGATLSSRLVAAGAVQAFAPETVPPGPALNVVMGDQTIATPGYGAGFLGVEGRLDIEADFAFSGLVAASGGVVVASGAVFRITGALWVGPPGFDIAGDLVIHHDRAALDAADARFRLPRRATIAGLVDR